MPTGEALYAEDFIKVLERRHLLKIQEDVQKRAALVSTVVIDLLTSTRTTGQPLVDDWDCFKTLVKSFKNQCGAKMEYGMKYAGALANICNMGVDVKQHVSAIEQACAH
ncbi:unnamed protein product [Brassica napus]|uniref:(rape) hypothetical protein n=1 Tax=Brassica napus TaxID=3708 RepID=A0A816RSF7_BRANA|nr:unnamed protein product [Brassica napus]